MRQAAESPQQYPSDSRGRPLLMGCGAIVLVILKLDDYEIHVAPYKKKPADEGKEGEDLAGRTGLLVGSPTLALL